MESLGVADEFEEFKRRASTGGIITPFKAPVQETVTEGKADKAEGSDPEASPRRRSRAQSAGVLRLPVKSLNLGSPKREKSPDTLDPKLSLEQFRVRSDSGGSASLLPRSRSGGSDRSPLADDYSTLSSDEGGEFAGESDVPKIRLKRPSVPVNQTSGGQTSSNAKTLHSGLSETKEETSCDHFLTVMDKPVRRKSDLDRADSLDTISMRPRISSMPGPGDVRRALWGRRRSRSPDLTCPCGCHLRKVRSFTIDHKTLEVHHEGDLFVTKSNPSLSSLEKLYWCPGGHLSAASSCTSGSCLTEGSVDSSLESIGGPDEKYYIFLLGRAFVGKTSLISSFLSETTIGSVSTSIGKSFQSFHESLASGPQRSKHFND